ncbi:hypothetical protein N7466_004282 [Penicillium verhagenii]|uniref:uncharacterized protein n=1 Tax=Penicillium verhagenii TaxID=1562060 RepID=UPI002544D703|nr:uncharacterized protein N7466_004282 [Penicillium verhagenii]KAJ5934735.1 hypothetical protein N7466_004282 [Penicillium verhagenii]
MPALLKRLFKKPRIETYGLDHAVLNIQLPPQTMWMNMGYWESTSDFPEACQALLHQVLSAGLLQSNSQCLRVLDVGCGCGDQSLYLTSLHRNGSSSTEESASSSALEASPAFSTPQARLQHAHPHPLLIDTYIGITLEPTQAGLAKSRVQDARRKQNQTQPQTHTQNNNGLDLSPAKIFCADAANPATWLGDLQTSISDLANTAQQPSTETWLLALDTMYHFRPSRRPILQFAHDTLHASYMGFDLILADNVSWWQLFLLRIICWALGAPFANFLTKDQYKLLLRDVGYRASEIKMTDVSAHVFDGLAGFLGRRVGEAEPFGLRVGKYRGARLVFDWWARSGIVRGYVVVARRS